MRNRIALLVLILIACSAPTEIQAEPVPVPVHGRPLNEAEFIQIVAAASQAMANSSDNAGLCLGMVEARPEGCAQRAVRYADALAAELRRSDNWPR